MKLSKQRQAAILLLFLVAVGFIVGLFFWNRRETAKDFLQYALALVSPGRDVGEEARRISVIHPALLSRSELAAYFAARAVDMDPALRSEAHYILGMLNIHEDCELAKRHLRVAIEEKGAKEEIGRLLGRLEEHGCLDAESGIAE